MKLLPLLAALPLLCASVVSANTLMSVGYFNGGGDVTAGPGDAPRDKCGYSGAINHGHTFCYM